MDGLGFFFDHARVKRHGFLVALAAEDRLEQPLGLEGEVAFHVFLQRAVVDALVGGHDGLKIGVRPTKQDVVKHPLLRAHAFHGLPDADDVVGQRTVNNGQQALAKISAGFRLHVLVEIATEMLGVGLADGSNL